MNLMKRLSERDTTPDGLIVYPCDVEGENFASS